MSFTNDSCVLLFIDSLSTASSSMAACFQRASSQREGGEEAEHALWPSVKWAQRKSLFSLCASRSWRVTWLKVVWLLFLRIPKHWFDVMNTIFQLWRLCYLVKQERAFCLTRWKLWQYKPNLSHKPHNMIAVAVCLFIALDSCKVNLQTKEVLVSLFALEMTWNSRVTTPAFKTHKFSPFKDVC